MSYCLKCIVVWYMNVYALTYILYRYHVIGTGMSLVIYDTFTHSCARILCLENIFINNT